MAPRGSDETGIEALIELMARLPGLGPRSARRAVLHLLTRRGQVSDEIARKLIRNLDLLETRQRD